jgi:ribosomal protein S18 acetylase RimI-like enzyme
MSDESSSRSSPIQIRRATIADAEVIGWHRARMFQDMSLVPEHLFEPFRAKSVERMGASLASGEYVGWLIPDPNDAQKIIAGAGVVLRQIPPIPIPDASGQIKIYDGLQAVIVNVFTEPQWRHRGLARLLMREVIVWSREQHIESVVLHASDQGRALYEQLGFIQTNEMRLQS